ncbi:MAG: CYTH domain-containing protein [Flavobacteriia bacterium]|jgi:hypothetical protein
MAIKIIIISIFLSFQLYSQGTEEQRKYILPKGINFNELQTKIEGLNDLGTYFHSKYVYYDLYLDSPGFDLFREGFSLRFRQRIINDSTTSYSLQLKSEMLVEKQIRIEVEETELDFYRVLEENKWVPISEILDRIFTKFDETNSLQDSVFYAHNFKLLSNWITQKAGAPIVTFQKLKSLNPEVFSAKMISSFKPVLIGKSERIRGHVFSDVVTNQSLLKNLPKNKLSMNDVPPFFIKNPALNYLLESSIDNSHFCYIPNPNLGFIITEYEVENKYLDKLKGNEIMNLYEIGLIKTLNLKIELASKYKQSIQSILTGKL